MRILLVGSGGREHALAWKLSRSPRLTKLFIAPGNGGTAGLGVNLPIKDDDIPALVACCRDKKIDLVVVGPELPLVLGLRDALDRIGVRCFGPDTFAAQLEGSKAFSKTIMRAAGVPTADFEVFDEVDPALEHVRERDLPMVVKADGLAAGKGVVVAATREEAVQAVREMMVEKIYGAAGERVVVEDALVGEEASFIAFCDGKTVLPLPSSQDHKPVGEGDTGPNTGGMGAYSPAPVLPDADFQAVADLTVTPIIHELARRGHPFVGVIYAGLMMTEDGPRVLEYNVRFGDPECQPLMVRLKSDLIDLIEACLDGRLEGTALDIRPEPCICVVAASKGYPGKYDTGLPISGLEEANGVRNACVFHAGTRLDGDRVLTAGGRVLGVTALGDDLAAAKNTAYAALARIDFPGITFRRDIGDKGIRRLSA